VDSAVVGAGGVIVGAALTFCGQLINEGIRGRRERESEEKRDTKALRLAARLVMEELAEANTLIEQAARTGRYWRAPRQIPTETWNQYRTDLAIAIEVPLDWRIVTAAYDALNNLNWTVQHRRTSDQTVDGARLGVFINADDHTRDVWRSVRQAIGVLERIIGVMGPASRVLGEEDERERGLWPHGDGDDFDEEAARIAEMERRQQEAFREEFG